MNVDEQWLQLFGQCQNHGLAFLFTTTAHFPVIVY